MTRDYGSKTLVDETETDPHSSETVIRFLDRGADITTRYGGGFVQSIDGLAGTESGGRRYDWFFYVNGLESPVGSAEVQVHGGDRIWWDYRDWTNAMRVPAVVGSWPQPFAQASADGKRQPVRVECLAAGGACQIAAGRLADAGVRASVEGGEGGPSRGTNALRLLVGPWNEVRDAPAVDELRGGPAATGVFSTPPQRRSGISAPMPGSWRRCKTVVSRRPGSSPGRQGLRCGEPRALSTRRHCVTAMPSQRRCTRPGWRCRSSAEGTDEAGALLYPPSHAAP